MTPSELWTGILAMERAYAACRREVTEEFRLTAAEFDVLLFLANNEERDTAADIVRTRKIPKSQVSLAVNALIGRGLLTGEHRPGDRKSVHLRTTAAAGPIVAAGRAAQERFATRLFGALTEEEKEQFIALQRRMIAAIAAGEEQ